MNSRIRCRWGHPKNAIALLIILSFSSNVAAGRPDPPMQAVLDTLTSLKPRPLPELSPVEARTEPGSKDAFKELLKKRNGGALPAPESVARVEDRTVPGPAGPRTVRVYTPEGKGPLPVAVYVHGGGWTVGSIAGYDPSYRALANAARCVVISVSYRLAPENKFPSGLEDVYAAFQYIRKNAAQFGGDPKRVAIVGESAGGNLAAAVCLLSHDRKAALPIHQVLIYPITDTRTNTSSYRAHKYAVPLDRPQMVYFIEQVVRTKRDLDSPYLAVLRAPSLRGLPPATVITAEIDPLNAEGVAYANRLKASGVPVRYKNYDGATHEFFSMGAIVPDAKEAVQFVADGLKAAFAK
ncbi:MAG: alpha/beta hydrolase fold domain-containing protein [Akkermansiaceae bacterium]|nr:alpha/beta hydrolase fold domain-containing protein [Armatimonadota bacterium]